jgi:hypothetical protein
MTAFVANADRRISEHPEACKQDPRDMKIRPEVNICPLFSLAGFVGWQQQDTDGGVCDYG